MSIGATSTDIQGGFPGAYAYGGYPAGGFGGAGIIEGLLLGTLLRGGFGGNTWGNNWGNWGGPGFGGPFGASVAGAGTVVAEQNVSDLRKDVSDVDTHVEALGNEIQGALAQQTLGQTQEFRNLDNRLCESEKTTMQGFFAIQTQNLMNTQAVKDQLTAQGQIIAENFCAVKEAIHADGDATRALINQIETQNLRDKILALERGLDDERRNRQFREVEINVSQVNQQTQAQLQAQLQSQSQAIGNALNMLGDQINRQTNSMINLGTMTGNAQSATNANTKVNS